MIMIQKESKKKMLKMLSTTEKYFSTLDLRIYHFGSEDPSSVGPVILKVDSINF